MASLNFVKRFVNSEVEQVKEEGARGSWRLIGRIEMPVPAPTLHFGSAAERHL